ncbi:MAG: hypothetical protein J6J79_08300 [Lachnospiraceae bacterium]|nr:hypothetical protein [Lachnospiraceae bacterium]
MNIRFEGTDNVHNHTNVDRDTTTYRTLEDTGKVSRSDFALDISGTVMDNNAYAGHGQTAEEVMQQAGQQDISARRDYMAVMSNSMSTEDFAKLQKEGFHPGSEDIETVVTIVDHIKAALMKGGAQIEGYTDTLSGDKLLAITGSQSFANELQNRFQAYDVPVTEENVKAVVKAFDTLGQVESVSEGAEKYMIENKLAPTVENLYTSGFSASGDGSRQGKGYYAAGTVAGYYAKKPENIDYERLMPQIEKVIEEAGFSVGEETIDDAKWLIEKGIPLNEDTFSRKQQMNEVILPQTEASFLKAAAIAIADGKTPMQADITKKQSDLEKAVAIKEQVEQVSEETVDIIKAKNLPFTLKNLFAAYTEWKQAGEPLDNKDIDTEGRELLSQVKETMTIGTNLRLLRGGFSIESMSMEMLAERLKRAQIQDAKALTGEADAAKATVKSRLYSQTLFALESIKWAPAAVAAEVTGDHTLSEIQNIAVTRVAAYQKAGESYETLMTMPRKDMGDSIKKAFRNVDDILADLQKDIYDKNRKVVRIMGYNSMEMTEENFEKVRQADDLLTDVVQKMKPATVLSMIREGINPLTMTLSELNEYLDNMPTDVASEMESYSKFLYQLEQKSDISEGERSAYIGIYRLLRQIEKGDDAAVGAVLKTGSTPTLENLLTAVRSSRKKHMDYTVDDTFSGVSAKESSVPTILEQIEKGYMKTAQEFEEALANEQTQTVEKEFDKILSDEIRTAMGSEESVLQYLSSYGQTVSAENLLFAQGMLKGYVDIFTKYKSLTEENEETSESEVLEDFNDAESAQGSYEEMITHMQQKIESAVYENDYRALDIREMGMLYKQLGFMGSMAKEENYEMPVNINGMLTTVNLKMIHKEEGESKVAISFETMELGKNEAEFCFEGERLAGYSICDDKEVCSLLSEQKELFINLLEKENVQAGDIRFLTGNELDLADFAGKAVKERISGKTPDTLYKAAKAYIGYIQEISMQKGSAEYED